MFDIFIRDLSNNCYLPSKCLLCILWMLWGRGEALQQQYFVNVADYVPCFSWNVGLHGFILIEKNIWMCYTKQAAPRKIVVIYLY